MLHALFQPDLVRKVFLGSRVQEYISETAAEVIFGTPSKYCQGVGICRILSRAPKWAQLTCPHVPAHLSLSASGWLRLRFDRGSMPEPVARRYFGQPFFQIDEPCALPSRFRLLPHTAPCILQPGLYPILQTEKDWIIVLKTDGVVN